MKQKGINHFEYTRGLIVVSVLWFSLIIYGLVIDLMDNLISYNKHTILRKE